MCGGLAQLGERLNGIQEVGSSNLLPSTIHFVYVLQSLTTHRFYIGSTDHLIRRFRQHQAGYSKATRNRGPWWMPYYEILNTRTEATQREHSLKQIKNHIMICRLITKTYPEIRLF